jgi:hypothetical protein
VKTVEGKGWVVECNSHPLKYEVTGESLDFEACPECHVVKDVFRGQKCSCESEFPNHMKSHPWIKAHVAEEVKKAINEVALSYLKQRENEALLGE